jgi:hypothetical protein
LAFIDNINYREVRGSKLYKGTLCGKVDGEAILKALF